MKDMTPWVDKWVSPSPRNGQAALNNSVAVNPARRVGWDGMKSVEFHLLTYSSPDDINCKMYWTGFVISEQPVPARSDVTQAAKKAGWPVKRFLNSK